MSGNLESQLCRHPSRTIVLHLYQHCGNRQALQGSHQEAHDASSYASPDESPDESSDASPDAKTNNVSHSGPGEKADVGTDSLSHPKTHQSTLQEAYVATDTRTHSKTLTSAIQEAHNRNSSSIAHKGADSDPDQSSGKSHSQSYQKTDTIPHLCAHTCTNAACPDAGERDQCVD